MAELITALAMMCGQGNNSYLPVNYVTCSKDKATRRMSCTVDFDVACGPATPKKKKRKIAYALYEEREWRRK